MMPDAVRMRTEPKIYKESDIAGGIVGPRVN